VSISRQNIDICIIITKASRQTITRCFRQTSVDALPLVCMQTGVDALPLVCMQTSVDSLPLVRSK